MQLEYSLSNNIEYGIHVVVNKKIIVFTRPKNASRVTHDFILKGSKSGESACQEVKFKYGPNGISIEKVEYVITVGENGNETDSNDKDIVESFNKDVAEVLSGKTKKDILFVYRDPVDRFISGLYQEFLVTIQTPQFFYFVQKELTKDENEELIKIVRGLRNLNGNDQNESELTELNQLIEKNSKALEKAFETWYSYITDIKGFESAHTNNYLTMYNEILSLPKIDLNKIQFCNVSNEQVDTILKNYTGNIRAKGLMKYKKDEKGNIQKHLFSSKLIKEMINYSVNEKYANSLNHVNTSRILDYYLKEEMLAFHKLNLLVKSKKTS